MVSFNLDKLNELLAELKGLPKIKEVIALRKRLTKEKSKLEKPVKVPAPVDRRAVANQNRSVKQKRNWRFYKQIRNFFPDKPILEIRREFAKRKRGESSSIPDAVWQNPSP